MEWGLPAGSIWEENEYTSDHLLQLRSSQVRKGYGDSIFGGGLGIFDARQRL